ncbi:MAG: hypothetical protein HY911_10880 [Desulfobacterales bacterium]|nr:hypothetical protein [Desulfobacterales bacterium]
MHRRVCRAFGLLFVCRLLVAVSAAASNPAQVVFDTDHLVTFIQGENLEAPLVLLDDSVGEFDARLNQANREYLNGNKSLLTQIQSRLAAESVSFRLAGSSKRLLVVPERREAYAVLFEQYCRQAVAQALAATQLPDPYVAIATLREPPPPQANGSGGVTAYVVHNIADEYIEEYLFFDRQNDRTKIKIQLSNRVFTGRIGSYTSRLTFGAQSQIEFVHESYTLWQNSARNPINVLVAPVEETLHIALRTATETAIRQVLRQAPPETIEAVQPVVDEWMAVEEAMVGGLVARLMPEILGRLLKGPLQKEMAAALAQREVHAQYRYLDEGIRVVSELGVRPAIELYTSEPARFQRMIRPAEMAAAM